MIKDKTPCYCPHPDHDDLSPSAFVNIKDGRHYVHCSSCNWIWWEQDNTPDWEKLCKPYWSYETDIFDFGIQGEEFFFEKVGEKKFHVLTKTDSDKDQK